jgi:hypothetical protein
MPYVSAYPRQFNSILNFLNLEVSGDPSVEDTALYSWIDAMIDVCYEEAEGYCGQPLRSTSVNYTFNASKARQAEDSNIYWKFVPYFANTSLTSLQYRENEFDTYAAFDVSNYTWSTEPAMHFIVYKNISKGQFRATLQTGYTDAQMPNTVLHGIAEMVALLFRQSPHGGNWFGLNSIVSGGAGQTVSQSLKTDIGWHKYFALHYIPTV